MTVPAMANSRPTCISSGGCTTITASASATSMIHFQCNNGHILNYPIEVLGPPPESSSSAEHKPSNVLSLADNIDQNEETQVVNNTCNTKELCHPQEILIILGYHKIIITPDRNPPFIQPFSTFLTRSPSGLNCHYNITTATKKCHNKRSNKTLDSGVKKHNKISLPHRLTVTAAH